MDDKQIQETELEDVSGGGIQIILDGKEAEEYMAWRASLQSSSSYSGGSSYSGWY